MSNTHDIVCRDCKVKYWFGQSSRRVGLQIYDYKDENGQQYLARFMLEHIGHALVIENEHSVHVDSSGIEWDAEQLDWPPWGKT